jgi:hypothetical protein
MVENTPGLKQKFQDTFGPICDHVDIESFWNEHSPKGKDGETPLMVLGSPECFVEEGYSTPEQMIRV